MECVTALTAVDEQLQLTIHERCPRLRSVGRHRELRPATPTLAYRDCRLDRVHVGRLRLRQVELVIGAEVAGAFQHCNGTDRAASVR